MDTIEPKAPDSLSQPSLHKVVRRLRVLGGATAGFGGTLLKIPAAWIANSTWLPALLTADVITTGGVLGLTVGGAAVVASYSAETVQTLSGIVQMTFAQIRVGKEEFHLKILRVDDLSRLYVDYRRIFGSELIPEAQVAQWMKKNPTIAFEVLRIAKKGTTETSERVGFFELLPLTKSGEEKLRRDQPQTANLSPKDIHSATRWSMAKAYYIASIGVVDTASFSKPARQALARRKIEGVVMKLLRERLSFLSAKQTIEVYARPVTADGLRLVKDYKFRKRQAHLSDTQAIWSGDVHLGSAVQQTA